MTERRTKDVPEMYQHDELEDAAEQGPVPGLTDEDDEETSVQRVGDSSNDQAVDLTVFNTHQR